VTRILYATALFWCASATAADVTASAMSVLVQRCGQCHGAAPGMSGLQLTSRENLLKGGKRGPAVVPGHATSSLLYQAVAGGGKISMPPGSKLPDTEIAVIKAWIDAGAEWSTAVTALPGSQWWAFQAVKRPLVPAIAGVGKPALNPIDAFILARLRTAGLQPAAEASRTTLLRRACFDLTGLPPTAEQTASFLNDKSPDAWEKLIDSLLASPRYGEKWGRHWLDLARYGDTAGFEQDPYILEAWRYRDYVIKSFNDNKPFDRFTKEQIAGDEIYPDDPEAKTGTGFYRVNPNRDMLFKVEDLNHTERLTDAVDTTSAVFLGLTVGCARCHDHKFDPISQRDYYRMQAVFAAAVNDRAFMEYNAAHFYDIAANTREFKLRQIGTQIDRIEAPYRERLRQEKITKLEAPEQAAVKAAPEARTPDQQILFAKIADRITVSHEEIRAAFSPADSERMHGIEKRLVAMFAGYGPPPTAPAVSDIGREAPRTYIAQRGNPENPGEEVRPGFLTALGGGDIPDPPLYAKTTYRRKALAEWIANAENPLFSRVTINRIWQYHFGQGLLRTPSDFGTRAGKPSHPDLLDWLAAEFAERKWSIKAMHKLIMTSEAYRRESNASPEAARNDPGNLLLSHMNRRRLESEEIRDSVLAVSGALNLKMAGPPVVPPLEKEELYGIIGKPENAWMVTPEKEEHTRRSIYMVVRRTFTAPIFEAFDTPDGVLTCSRRNESTTAPQSLALLNSRFTQEEAKRLAVKAGTVDAVWRSVLGRDPDARERRAAEEFVARQTARIGSKEAALAEVARGLLNLNEFLYVD
jgi:hypothetical protein